MKLLVLSDSHGNLANMVAAVEQEAPDLMIHLGDGWRDAQELHCAYPSIPLEQVPGNCDFCLGEAQERLLKVAGYHIFICHGHTRGVKQGYRGAFEAAWGWEADLLLFGHTHRADSGEVNGLTWMNPGSVGAGRMASYGVVTLGASDGIRCVHRRVYPDG